ncbi:threonine ammonia-lyase [Abditibacterium utsteinense]|nr:threonine ammonia-lyase [Abditibacterium utsteinense]
MIDFSALPIQPADVFAAQTRIASGIKRTPCRHTRIAGLDLFLKFDSRQETHSFKERGALNKLLSLSETEKERGVVAASAGNHAQAVARHAGILGVAATIVMPQGTPFNKISRTQSYGARVVLHGETFDAAQHLALELSQRDGLIWISPFDDPLIMAGQGTLALEMLEDFPEIDTLVVPIGGGGLISGCAVVAKSLNPDIEIIGVQAALFPAMKAVLEGKPAPIARGRSLAEGIAVKVPGLLTRQVVAALVSRIDLVEESEIEDAINLLLEEEKTLAEGAGAAALALILAHPEQFRGKKVGVPICGGNLDMRLLATCLLRGLARSHRIVSLTIMLDDVPGGLALSAQTIAKAGGNVVEVQHQRQFGDVTGSQVELHITVETQDGAHVERILASLREQGLPVVQAFAN